jgi:hypothetical protein
VWSATLEILPRGKGRVRFDYRVPGVVRAANGRKHYRLVVQHQPKVHPEDLTVRLELPRIARSVRGRGWSRAGNVLVWSRKVKEDTVLEVSWR